MNIFDQPGRPKRRFAPWLAIELLERAAFIHASEPNRRHTTPAHRYALASGPWFRPGAPEVTLSAMRPVSSAATRVVRFLLCVVVIGCSTETAPSEQVDDPSCINRPFRAALHVDAVDPRRVWATDFESGRDVAVRPRPPDQFAFDPARPTVLFNSDGDVVSFSGEITVSGCFNPATDTLYIGPADVPDPNRGGG